MTEEDYKIGMGELGVYSPKQFCLLLTLAIWAGAGEEFGLELTYHDDEVMMFRRKIPLSKQLEDKR